MQVPKFFFGILNFGTEHGPGGRGGDAAIAEETLRTAPRTAEKTWLRARVMDAPARGRLARQVIWCQSSGG